MSVQWLAGADGCRNGWVVALVPPGGGEVRVRLVTSFAEIAAQPERPTRVAIDMPIGLPERIGPEGRGPERAVRPLLGERRSSVFSVPSRSAVYAETFGEACRLALATSDPPKAVSRQLFMIAPKIREIDRVLRAAPDLAERVYEVHPEVAFWRLNGCRALTEPKKVRGQPYGPGLARRRALLIADGFPVAAVEQSPSKGAAADDLIDALACAAIARRIHAGVAQPFPDLPLHDEHGLRIAIWA